MVAASDIGRANALIAEHATVTTAIAAIDNGGEIVSLEVSGGPPDSGFSGIGTKVATEYMHPPPQMMTAIRQSLVDRDQAILKELTDMGVTGLEGQQSVQRTTRRR